MKSLILLGCGGNAYDVLDVVDAINVAQAHWQIAGFLDDQRAIGSEFCGRTIVGRLADAQRFTDAFFMNTIGSDQNFRRRAELIAATGVAAERFATLVHPAAAVSSRAALGRGVCVNFGACIAGAVVVGDHVWVGTQAVIGHDAVLENHCVIAPAAVLSGFTRIGQAAYIGANATIKQRVTIGDEALIGMAAVVTRDVCPGNTVVGNPARPLIVAAGC